MSYAYHYHATCQHSPGVISNIDGIVTTAMKIDSMDRYREVKKAVAGTRFDPSELIICSLSLLHEVDSCAPSEGAK